MVQQGQTATLPTQQLDKVDMHFVCFIQHQGTLYELDSSKDTPVAHGPTTIHSLLADTAGIIQGKFIAADPSEHRFTIIALVAAS